MNIHSIKTNKITLGNTNIFDILDKFLDGFEENSILIITSKIISICEGSVVASRGIEKNDLVSSEADFYLPSSLSKYDFSLTIKDGVLLPTAGIDESNGDGYYILWPKNAQKTANKIRKYLVEKFSFFIRKPRTCNGFRRGVPMTLIPGSPHYACGDE